MINIVGEETEKEIVDLIHRHAKDVIEMHDGTAIELSHILFAKPIPYYDGIT